MPAGHRATRRGPSLSAALDGGATWPSSARWRFAQPDAASKVGAPLARMGDAIRRLTGAKCFARRPALRGSHSTNWRWKSRVCSDHRTMAGASRDRPQTVRLTVLLLRYLDLRP